ncbi:MAG: 3-deoxy-manno-octulosonate cytidylyltransferase [Gammaproteobacteria bacterium]|jgi:3-deoxy-manno-octulosonate cytidylyltransferase (CMP-KDO synthetase)
MSFSIVIPARYASTRLPGKPLLDIAGKPMIQHVYERAMESGAKQVIIATDDIKIQQAAEQFNAEVCMTSDKHRSGTERLAEVIDTCNIDDDHIVINLQGDEPLLPPKCLQQVAQALEDNKDASVATLCTHMTSVDEIFDPHAVKVVLDHRQHALYFTRAPVPWDRERFNDEPQLTEEQLSVYRRHIGLYAYRAGFVKKYIELPQTDLEKIESLEQLRVMWHGFSIVVPLAEEVPGPGVDTVEDLENVRNILS